jgi:hypothetical protein
MMGWMAPLRHLSAKLLSDRISSEWEPSMGEVTTIGLDLAKHVFQVHGVDAEGATVLRKQLRRAQVLAFFSRLPPCLVGLEACATAHYWARELRALGHELSQVCRDRAATSLACPSSRPILLASASNCCARLSPTSAGWRSWPMSAIPALCWKWQRFRRRPARSALRSLRSKSGERRISSPPSRRSTAA